MNLNNQNTPQLEDGFIRIATDIAKYLAQTYMSSYESQIMWSIFIKTYGFQKKDDWISNSQFVSLTKMHKAHVSRTIKKLILRKIVTQTGNKIAFQKDAAQWCELPKRVTVTQIGTSVAHLGNRELPKRADTIDTLTKDTITKDNTDTAQRLIDFFNQKTGHTFRLTTGRIKKINERLKTFTAREIAQAIDKMLNTPFYKGDNERKWQADPDYILRNDEQIDRFLGTTKTLQVTRLSDLVQTTHENTSIPSTTKV